MPFAPALVVLAALGADAGELRADRLEVLAWSRGGNAALLRLQDRTRGAEELLIVDGATGATSRRLDARPTDAAACAELLVELEALLAAHDVAAFVAPGWCDARDASLLLDARSRALPRPPASTVTVDAPTALQVGQRPLGCVRAERRLYAPDQRSFLLSCGDRPLLERPAFGASAGAVTSFTPLDPPSVALVVVEEQGQPAVLLPALFSPEGTFEAPQLVPWRGPTRADEPRGTTAKLAAAVGGLLALLALWLRAGAGVLRRVVPPPH